jgi:transketolase
MDILALTTFLSPFLPFLIKFGEKFGEKSAETVGSKVGEDGWNKAKKIWEKLHPKVEAKEDTKVAAEQVATKPDSKARQAVFQEELETLLKENPDLAAAITQIWQEELPAANSATNKQTITNNEGQAINNMTNSKAIKIDGDAHGGMNF